MAEAKQILKNKEVTTIGVGTDDAQDQDTALVATNMEEASKPEGTPTADSRREVEDKLEIDEPNADLNKEIASDKEAQNKDHDQVVEEASKSETATIKESDDCKGEKDKAELDDPSKEGTSDEVAQYHGDEADVEANQEIAHEGKEIHKGNQEDEYRNLTSETDMTLVLSIMLEENGLTEDQLNVPCSENVFLPVSEVMPPPSQTIQYLGLSKRASQASIGKEVGKMELLWTWKRQLGKKATYLALLKVFVAMEDRLTAECITKYVKNLVGASPTTHSLSLDRAISRYPNWSDMSEADKKATTDRLILENSTVRRKFATTLNKISTSFQNRNQDLEELKAILFLYEHPPGVVPIAKSSSMFPELLAPGSSLSAMFIEIAQHSSWFNHQLLEKVVEELGNKSERRMLRKYKADVLAPYLKRSIFEVPCDTLATGMPIVTAQLQVADEIDIAAEEVLYIKNRIAKLLRMPALEFVGYAETSLSLIFGIPKFLFESYSSDSHLHKHITEDPESGCNIININITNILLSTGNTEAQIVSKILNYRQDQLKKSVSAGSIGADGMLLAKEPMEDVNEDVDGDEDGLKTRSKKEDEDSQDTHEYRVGVPLAEHSDRTIYSPPVDMMMDDVIGRSEQWFSPSFYTNKGGYRMCLSAEVNEGHLTVYAHLMAGDHDSDLAWPFRGSVDIQLLNQAADHSHITQNIAFTESDPEEACERVVTGERANASCYLFSFAPIKKFQTKKKEYLKNNTLRFCIKRVTIYASRIAIKVPIWHVFPSTSNVTAQFIVSEFSRHKAIGDKWSGSFYTHDRGYKFCLIVRANGYGRGEGRYVSVGVGIMRGDHDDSLTFPFRGVFYVMILNWREDRNHVIDVISFTDENDRGPIAGARVTKRDYALYNKYKSTFLPHSLLGYNTAINTQYIDDDDCMKLKVIKVDTM